MNTQRDKEHQKAYDQDAYLSDFKKYLIENIKDKKDLSNKEKTSS